jgi:hypothetical protein
MLRALGRLLDCLDDWLNGPRRPKRDWPRRHFFRTDDTCIYCEVWAERRDEKCEGSR